MGKELHAIVTLFLTASVAGQTAASSVKSSSMGVPTDKTVQQEKARSKVKTVGQRE